jgi:hypothetical protein
MASNDIDVADILRQIKQEVREQHRERQFSVSLSRVSALEEVHATCWVNPHRPIAWPHWPKGLRPKLVALVQKLMRRSLRWYIAPIVEDQNRFNAAVVAALDVLAQENALLRVELQARQPGPSYASDRE